MSKEIKKSRVPKLRFPEFWDAGEWEEKIVSDFASCFSGGTPSTSNKSFYGGNIPWITSSDLNNYKIKSVNGKITEAGFKKSSAKIVKKGTLLIALYGATSGVSAITEIDATINQAVLAIEVDKFTDSYFLLSYFRLQKNKIIENYTQGGQPNLSGQIIKSLAIKIPSYAEQKAIANCLSSIDELITAQTQKIDALKAHKKGLIQQLLTGKKRFLRFDGEWEMKAGYKMTGIGLIPKDWDIKSYGEVFDFLSTISNSRADLCFKGDFGYIHYGDIHTRWENTLNLAKSKIPELQRDKIKKLPAPVKNGDLVMADASEDYEGIAKTVEVKNVGDKTVFSGTHTFLMRDRNGVFVEGMRGYIHKIPVVQQQIHKVATGSKVLGISKNTLKNILIPIPKLEEQKAIAGCLSSIDELITAQAQKIDALKAHKKGLMQQLFPSN